MEHELFQGQMLAMSPSCPHSQAATAKAGAAEEALSNAREAILLTIEDKRERGDAIPDPADDWPPASAHPRRMTVEEFVGALGR
jgi:hypothetical protein